MKKRLSVACLCALGFAAGAACVKNGESVAFLGDSITQGGWQCPYGYVRMCQAAFKANGFDD